MVLTGGSSRRMGYDKATIQVEGKTIARRTAEMLGQFADPVIEVGPGYCGIEYVQEQPAGLGPLSALVQGWRSLVQRTGDKRDTIVLSCDMPDLSTKIIGELASRPSGVSAVPVIGGMQQPLCARWSVGDLENAISCLQGGSRAIGNIFGPSAELLDENFWDGKVPLSSFEDVDSPDDLYRKALAAPESCDTWTALSGHVLPVDQATRWCDSPGCGAVVTFCGTVRDHSPGREQVEELAYEAYEAPALRIMGEIAADARNRFSDIDRIAILHRLGRLEVGETAVVVAVSAPHRPSAFEACSWLIDTVKSQVPIWKYEKWAAGEDWSICDHVHPSPRTAGSSGGS